MQPGGDRSATTVPRHGDQPDHPGPTDPFARIALWATGAAWAVVLVLIAARPIFITHDSLSNNVHIRWLSDRLWGGDGIPLHIGTLANGEALSLPYGSVPWITASWFFPILGDRVVGIWMVLGVLGTIAATFWAFPNLRRGWWAVAVLLNPALVISPLLGQLPFLWSAALLLSAIGCWRRSRPSAAVVLAALAQIVHPAVTIPILAIVVLVWLPFEAPDRRRSLLGSWIVAVAASLPAVWAVAQSPVVSQTSVSTQLVALVQTVGARMLVVLLPMALNGLQARGGATSRTPVPAAVCLVFLALQWPMYDPFGMDFAWPALARDADPAIEEFGATGEVVEGDTYRVLSGRDGKYGLYATVVAGGVLDAELFPEGLHRGPFGSTAEYAGFLAERQVDHVVAFDSYSDHYTRSNEPDLLEEMSRAGCTDAVEVSRSSEGPGWILYDVDRDC